MASMRSILCDTGLSVGYTTPQATNSVDRVLNKAVASSGSPHTGSASVFGPSASGPIAEQRTLRIGDTEWAGVAEKRTPNRRSVRFLALRETGIRVTVGHGALEIVADSSLQVSRCIKNVSIHPRSHCDS